MKVTNVTRRVWTTVLAKVVLRCKIFLDDILARGRIALSQFRGLSDWLGGYQQLTAVRRITARTFWYSFSVFKVSSLPCALFVRYYRMTTFDTTEIWTLLFDLSCLIAQLKSFEDVNFATIKHTIYRSWHVDSPIFLQPPNELS